MNPTCYYALYGNECPDMDELHSEGEASERYFFLRTKFNRLCAIPEKYVNCSTYKKLNESVSEVEVK